VAITTVDGLQFTTVVATDDVPMRVDQVQSATREGPCVHSLLDSPVYQANDLATDTRFPLFAPTAASRTGVRSMLSFRLFTREGSLGALNIYAKAPEVFTSASLAMGALFAAHSRIATRPDAAWESRDQPTTALGEDRVGSIAVEILMAATSCDEQDAWAQLEHAARSRWIPVVEVAERIVEPDVAAEADDEPGVHAARRSAGTDRLPSEHPWRRGDARALLAGLAGLGVALGLVVAFGAGATQRPIAVLLVPVLAVALVASAVTTSIVAMVAVAVGGVLVVTGDLGSADLRLRFAALVVGAVLAVVFAVVRQGREESLRVQAATIAVVQARAETESVLSVMLARLPELDAATDAEGVARRACPMGRDIFGADHVSYWQVDGADCVLVCRSTDGQIPVGTRVPRHLFLPSSPVREVTRTTWVRASDVSVPPAGAQVARATHAEVGTSTPIQVGGDTVAYLGMSWEQERPEPDRSWLDAVDRFADQIALSTTVIRRRAAQRDSLSLAQRFQAGMLPRIPQQELLTVRSLYRPGLQQMLLGGDFLDVITVDQQRVAFVLGDVAGHGPEQAALGATLRGAWLSVASIPTLGPQDWARALNRIVHERGPAEGVFVTAVMGRLNPRDRTLEYVSAGHPPPILLRPTVSDTPLGDPVLGPDPGIEFTTHRLELPEQWAVLLVTDGLFEGRLPGHGRARGDYDDFLAHLRSSDHDIEEPSWLSGLADTLEDANGGPLSDDAAALLLTPR
jgi:serine phosphatase RsbU (regulator of sigma subunit)